MKKHWLIYSACLVLLAFGFVFVGCSDGSSSGTQVLPGYNIEYTEFAGTDALDVEIVVRIFRTTQRSFAPANGDQYWIRYGGQEISSGTITVDGDNITFWPSGGAASFSGTLIGWFLNIPSIPYSGGTITGFSLQARAGAGGAPQFIEYTLTQLTGNNSGTPTDSLRFVFDEAVDDFRFSGIRITNGSGSVVLDPDSLSASADYKTWIVNVADTDDNVVGLVFVSITHRNVDPTVKPLEIFSDTAGTALAAAIGTFSEGATASVSNNLSTKLLRFSFTADPVNVTPDEIVIVYPPTNAGSIIVRPSTHSDPNPFLSDEDTGSTPFLWDLEIEVVTPGNVIIYINRTGFSAAPATVAVHKARRIITLWQADGLTGLAAGNTGPVVGADNLLALRVTEVDTGNADATFNGFYTVTISGANATSTGNIGRVIPLDKDSVPVTANARDLTPIHLSTGNTVPVEFVDGVGRLNLILYRAVDIPTDFTIDPQNITFSIHGVEGSSDPVSIRPTALTSAASVRRIEIVTPAGAEQPVDAGDALAFNDPSPVLLFLDLWGNPVMITGGPTVALTAANNNDGGAPVTVAAGGTMAVAMNSATGNVTLAGASLAGGTTTSLDEGTHSLTLTYSYVTGGPAGTLAPTQTISFTLD
ncbi:MAG: hypothetical protein FWH19_00975 [Treponema sp.]|nr:hypothetical protein [Treponema sp.]